MEHELDLGHLPATQEEFEAWCDRLAGSELGRFEFLYGCVVAEPPAGFALPSGDTVAPDAALVLRETWEAAPPPIPGRFLTVVPDLVVEVLSPSTRRRDLRTKRDIYECNGVREYWLVDAPQRSITVIARDADDRLGAERTVTGDESARSVLLAGFAVRPSDIFP
jgi:Uma2 family endonuclease